MNTKNQSSNKKPSSNRNRRNRRGRPNSRPGQRGPQKQGPMSEDKVVKSYYVMIEKLQIARKKYYDDFHHQDPNRVRKLRRNFERSLEELRQWESKLDEKYIAIISSLENNDFDYSTAKNLSPIGVNAPDSDDHKDPHFIKQQKEAIEKYKEDNEESVGTMDEYRSYKNIT